MWGCENTPSSKVPLQSLCFVVSKPFYNINPQSHQPPHPPGHAYNQEQKSYRACQRLQISWAPEQKLAVLPVLPHCPNTTAFLPKNPSNLLVDQHRPTQTNICLSEVPTINYRVFSLHFFSLATVYEELHIDQREFYRTLSKKRKSKIKIRFRPCISSTSSIYNQDKTWLSEGRKTQYQFVKH